MKPMCDVWYCSSNLIDTILPIFDVFYSDIILTDVMIILTNTITEIVLLYCVWWLLFLQWSIEMASTYSVMIIIQWKP